MEWITVRRHRDSRESTIKPTKTYERPYEPCAEVILPRLDPIAVQRFILRRIRLCLSQDHADVICGFPPRTINAIESHRIYPSTSQLVALDAHLTVLEEIQRR